MRNDEGPHALLEGLKEGQRRLGMGVGASLALGLLIGSVSMQQTSAAALGVADVTSFALKLDAGQEYAHADFAPPRPGSPLVKLGTYIANPLDASKIRYVRVSVQVSVPRVDRMENYGLNKIRTRAAITSMLSGRSVDELGAPGGQEAARTAVREIIMEGFPKGYILGVHFTEFVVQ
jgi:flagellar basal body-associated protein FliL